MRASAIGPVFVVTDARLRPYLIVLVAISVTMVVVATAVWNVDVWAMSIVLLAGGLLAIAISLRDEPPEFVARWGRGAVENGNLSRHCRRSSEKVGK